MTHHTDQVALSGVPGDAWRRVHKITPILNAWKVVVAVVAAFAWQVSDQLSNLSELWQSVDRYRTTVILAVIGLLVLVALLATLYSALAWRRMQFAVTSESVDPHEAGVAPVSYTHLTLPTKA